jgi:PAS domain S-box-containing protein
MTDPPVLVLYRLRTVRVGIQATAFVLASLIVFLFIPSEIEIDEGRYITILVIAALVGVVISMLPWLRLFERGWGMPTMYLWSAVDIVLITGVLASVGENGSPLFVLYGLTTVFAAASYRTPIVVATLVFTLACYITMVFAVEGMLVLASAVVRFASLTGIAFITEFLSKELQEQNVRLEAEVAERKATQERLAASEAALEEAQTIAHLGSWEWNIQNNELTWSDELLRIFGVDREEFGGDYDSYLQFVHPEDRDRVNHLVREASRKLEPFSYEHRILVGDGSEKIVLSRGSVEAGPSGEAARMVGTSLDLTDRKKAEATKRELDDLASRQQQAMEINDNVVQGLTVAAYSLESGDTEKAGRALKSTLGAARKIVEKLLSGRFDQMKPGDFVRSEPAQVGLDNDGDKKEEGA